MSKRHLNSTQPPYSVSHPPIVTREKPPIPFPTKSGIELHCPFCDDHHILRPDLTSPCGTRIDVMAVQEVISAKTVRTNNLVCLKCHKGNGEMVRYRDSYVHLANCAPGVQLLQDMPKFNKLARLVYATPKKMRGLVERVTGRADQVLEIDEKGEKTGKVVGYFFRRGFLQKE